MRVAREKAARVWREYRARPGRIRAVIGADTAILFKGQIIGQPKDKKDALRILKRLNGHYHEVITGVAVFYIASGQFTAFTTRSKVWMRDNSMMEIAAYVATGEPFGKAGAYAIQGKGRKLVARYEGSYSNIIGLPVDELKRVIRCL
jgi:septum formation protein